MIVGSRRGALLLSSTLVGLAMFSFGGAAQAADPTYQFDIPAESLGQALTDFSRASSQQIVFSEEVTAGKSTKGLHGRYTAVQALDALLAGSGLRVETNSSGVMMVQSKNAQAAQTEGASTENPGSVVRVETVVVTGTNIRGEAALTSPLTVIDRAAINRTGYTDTTQLVASLPQNFGGGGVNATADGQLGPGSGAGDNIAGATAFNLKGLGPDSTLVLLNGNRIAPGIEGQAVDISLIPLAAIDRVEIVSDGASSIYGADAVAGVVNIILRKDYDGAESSVRYGTVTNGSLAEETVDQLVGKNWETGGALVSFEYENQSDLPSSDRSFAADAVQPTDILPSFNEYSGTFSGHQDLLSNLDVSLDALFTHKDTDTTLSYAQGTATSDNSHRQTNLSGAIGYEPFGDWRVELSGTFSESRDEVSYSRYYQPLPSGFVLNAPYYEFSDQLALGNVKADGTVLTLPGGDLKVAFGGSYSSEGYQGDGLYFTSTGTPKVDLQRQVASAFGEMYLPIVGDGNALPLINKLVVSASARFDHYSDFGDTTNPKVGILWQPTNGLRIQSSFGTSFRAPNFEEERQSNSTSYLFNYPFASPSGSGTVPVFVLQGASGALRPEKSRDWNLGFDYEPELLPGAKVSVDYYNIHFDDRIITPPFDVDALAHPNEYGSLITPLASDAAAAAFLASQLSRGVTYFDILGTGSAGIRYIYDAATLNAAEQFQSGFDVSGQYEFSSQFGNFLGHVNAAVINQISTAFAPGASATDLVNTYGNPLHLRLRGDLTWSKDDWELTAAVNYANSYKDTSAISQGTIGSFATVDLNLQYKPTNIVGWANGVTLSLSVQNLFDISPPFAEGSGFSGIHYDVGNASPLGRFITVGVKKDW